MNLWGACNYMDYSAIYTLHFTLDTVIDYQHQQWGGGILTAKHCELFFVSTMNHMGVYIIS